MHKRISLTTLLKKINELSKKIDDVREQLPIKEKKWLKFEECVPPKSVCKDIWSMMLGIRSYTGFLGKLSEYYGCKPMEMYVDKDINPKYIAEYRPGTNRAYSKGTTVNEDTVLHEFFHHLCYLNIVVVNKSKQEKYADMYSKMFMGRVNS